MFRGGYSRVLRAPVAPSQSNNIGQSVQQSLRLGRLNHVAIAVSNLEEASSLYRDILGAKVSQPVV
jgi:catechol-2,3-dioxygenase